MSDEAGLSIIQAFSHSENNRIPVNLSCIIQK